MIPRIMHRIWVGDPMPDEYRAFAEGWVAKHPDWRHILWTDDRETVLTRHEIQPAVPTWNTEIYHAAAALARDHEGQLRADLLRYEILYAMGGVYVDADFECYKAIDPLLEGVRCFAAWEKQNVWIANGLMGAIERHPFIRLLLEHVGPSVRTHPGERVSAMSGPRFLTKMWRLHGEGVTVLPQKLIYPYSWNELQRRNEDHRARGYYMVHHWNNRRRELARA